MPVALEWTKGLQYKAEDGEGHRLIVESRRENEPEGFSPTKLLLIAAAGCMANHVLEILRKKRMAPVKFRVLADGKRATEHPRKFVSIDLTFEIQGAIPQNTLDDVIGLAKEKYCSVLNTIGSGTKVTFKSKIYPV